jgi:hypothetical protein
MGERERARERERERERCCELTRSWQFLLVELGDPSVDSRDLLPLLKKQRTFDDRRERDLGEKNGTFKGDPIFKGN